MGYFDFYPTFNSLSVDLGLCCGSNMAHFSIMLLDYVTFVYDNGKAAAMGKTRRHFWGHGELELVLTMELTWYAVYNLVNYTAQYFLRFPFIPEVGKFEHAVSLTDLLH